jgi:hypothetical protein
VPLIEKDVKNKERSDYVYENTGASDKMSGDKWAFSDENV